MPHHGEIIDEPEIGPIRGFLTQRQWIVVWFLWLTNAPEFYGYLQQGIYSQLGVLFAIVFAVAVVKALGYPVKWIRSGVGRSTSEA